MLEKIRQNTQGVFSWGIVLLIALSFALWGITDYFGGAKNRGVAAKVNGENISWQAVDLFYERIHRQFGNIRIDEHVLREQLRSELIKRAALLSSVRSLGFRVGDVQIAEALIKNPSFQVDGKFSKDRYLEVLEKAAYTDTSFRQKLEQDVLLSQLQQGLSESSFVLPEEITRLVSVLDQRRNFGYFLLPVQKYQPGVKISPQDIQSYYADHQTNYVLPEQVSVEYVELSLDQLAKQQTVSEQELKNYYEEHLSSYSAPDRVRVRHILIEAKDQAENLFMKIKKGSDFATLAKEHSLDTGSAKNGGDLGWFVKGQMVPEFEQAAFGLTSPKEMAGPIQTQYGYHLIQLVERKAADTQSFKEVRALVLEQIQREKAYIVFAEMGEKMAKIAFENTSSLEPVAKLLGLKIQETPLFSREGPQDKTESSNGFIRTPAVLEAAFSDAVLKQKNNSEPLPVGDFNTVVLRIKKHQPAVQQSLEQVSKKVEDQLVLDRAMVKVKELALSIQKKLQKGEISSRIAASQHLNWQVKTGVSRSAKDLDKTILETVFQMPYRFPDGKEDRIVKTFPLSNGDYVVLMLNSVTSGDIHKSDENAQKAYQQSMTEAEAQFEFALYTNRVLNESKIEITEQPSS